MNMDGNLIGIFSWYGIDIPFKERISKIKNAGFESTSVWFGQEETLFARGDKDALANIVRDYGLYLENIHSPYEDINDLWDQFKAVEVKNRIKTEIEFCERHEIPILVSHITKGDGIKEITSCGITTLKEIIKYAEERNVIIAIENTRQMKVFHDLFGLIQSGNLGFCYDSSHDNLYCEKPFDLLRTYKDKLVCTHISDNGGTNDDHWLPFNGIIDWNKFSDYFPESYTGVYTLEVVPKDNGENTQFLTEAYEAIHRIRDNCIIE